MGHPVCIAAKAGQLKLLSIASEWVYRKYTHEKGMWIFALELTSSMGKHGAGGKGFELTLPFMYKNC